VHIGVDGVPVTVNTDDPEVVRSLIETLRAADPDPGAGPDDHHGVHRRFGRDGGEELHGAADHRAAFAESEQDDPAAGPRPAFAEQGTVGIAEDDPQPHLRRLPAGRSVPTPARARRRGAERPAPVSPRRGGALRDVGRA